ncbi:MAG: hypothetical protein LW832_11040 [Parachlamydia sp.]|jgi:DNA polymerase/3'-5' exonuclease PolX|nr:hypothetical protein [Parachlamydia sp.]
MNQYEIASIFREIAQLVELTDHLPQKAISYRKAAATLDSIENLQDYFDKLDSLPGIGKKMAEMIQSLLYRGSLHYYDELKKKDVINTKNLPEMEDFLRIF